MTVSTAASAQMTPEFVLGVQGGAEKIDDNIGPDFAFRVGGRLRWPRSALTIDLLLNGSFYAFDSMATPGPEAQRFFAVLVGIRADGFVNGWLSGWFAMHLGGFSSTQSGSFCATSDFCHDFSGAGFFGAVGLDAWLVNGRVGIGPLVGLDIYFDTHAGLKGPVFGIDASFVFGSTQSLVVSPKPVNEFE